MKTRQVKRHYCEFCGKGMFQIPAMQKHERHCTGNIERACRMCETECPEYSKIIHLAIDQISTTGIAEAMESGEYENVLKFIREQVCECPACILTVIRIGQLPCAFDYKAEAEDWIKEKNDQQYQRYSYDQ